VASERDTMAASLKLANIWRVISDVDLDGIRAAAQAPFEIAVVGEDDALTDAVRAALLAGEDAGAAPWVRTFNADDFITRPIVPVLALIVSATPDLSVRLKHVDEHCIRARVARVTVIVGNASAAAAARRIGESARVAIAAPSAREIERAAPTLVGEVQGDQRLAIAKALPVFRQAVAAAIVDE